MQGLVINKSSLRSVTSGLREIHSLVRRDGLVLQAGTIAFARWQDFSCWPVEILRVFDPKPFPSGIEAFVEVTFCGLTVSEPEIIKCHLIFPFEEEYVRFHKMYESHCGHQNPLLYEAVSDALNKYAKYTNSSMYNIHYNLGVISV